MPRYDITFYQKKAATFESMMTDFYKQAKAQLNGTPYAHSRKDGSFFFIPLGTESSFGILYNFFAKILDFRPVEYFLDAGSGLGNIVSLAFHMNLARNCHGIEYDKRYVGFANKFMGSQHSSHCHRINSVRSANIKYFHDDIMIFNDYSNYDVIYYYCPFSDGGMERRFEEMVEDQMKVGAYLIGCNKQGWEIRKDTRFECVEGVPGNIWKKVSDGPRLVSYIPPDHQEDLLESHAKRWPGLLKGDKRE